MNDMACADIITYFQPSSICIAHDVHCPDTKTHNMTTFLQCLRTNTSMKVHDSHSSKWFPLSLGQNFPSCCDNGDHALYLY